MSKSQIEVGVSTPGLSKAIQLLKEFSNTFKDVQATVNSLDFSKLSKNIEALNSALTKSGITDKIKNLEATSKKLQNKLNKELANTDTKQASNSYVLDEVLQSKTHRKKFLAESGLSGKNSPGKDYGEKINSYASQIESGALSGRQAGSAKRKIENEWNKYLTKLAEDTKTKIQSFNDKIDTASISSAQEKLKESVSESINNIIEKASDALKKSSTPIELSQYLKDINALSEKIENDAVEGVKEATKKTSKKGSRKSSGGDSEEIIEKSSLKFGNVQIPYDKINKEFLDLAKTFSQLKLELLSFKNSIKEKEDKRTDKTVEAMLTNAKSRERNSITYSEEAPSLIANRQAQALKRSAEYLNDIEGNLNKPLKNFTQFAALDTLGSLLMGDFSSAGKSLTSGLLERVNLGVNKFVKKRQDSAIDEVLSETETFTKWKKKKGNENKTIQDFKKEATEKDILKALRELNNRLKTDKNAANKIKFAGKSPALAIGIAAAAVIKLGEAVVNFGKQAVEAYENIQSLQTQLEVVFGTKSQASDTFNQIEEYSKKSPFGVETMTQQAINLKQSGVSSSELMDVLGRLGDIASGNAEKMRSVSETYARILSSTTVTARDMKQLSNAGVPAYKALVESMHKNGATVYQNDIEKSKTITASSIRSMLQTGKVSAEDFTAMLKDLTDEGGAFYNSVELGAKTLKARKQNLADKKEMALSYRGERWTETGLYKGFLAYQENLWAHLEEINKNVVLEKNEKKQKVLTDLNYNLEKKSPELYKLLKNIGYDDNKEYKNAYEAHIAASSERYKNENSKLEAYSQLSPEEKIQIIDLMRQRDSSGWRGVGIAILGGTDPSGEIEKELTRQYNNLPKDYQVQFLDYKELKKNFSKDEIKEAFTVMASAFNESFLPEKDEKVARGVISSNRWAFNDTELTRYFQEGYDKIETALNATTSTRNTRTQAKLDWDKGAFGSMIAGDEEAARLQAIKDRINEYWDTYIYMTDKAGEAVEALDTSKINSLELFNKIEETLVDEEEQLKLSLSDLYGSNGQQLEGAADTIALFGQNMQEIMDVLGKDTSYEAVKSLGGYQQVLEALKVIEQTGGEISEGTWKYIQETFTTLLGNIEKTDKLDNAKKEEAKTALERGGNKRIYSRENADKINARQVSLWQTLVGNATGIAATRVKQIGGAKAMNMYATNIGQRNNFKTIASALLQSGVSLGDISKNLKRTGIGNDGTQLFDWNSSMKKIEEMASKRNVETQQALIGAYQDQIKVLEELELGGVATLDDWNELHSASAILGSAFSLSATRMADGSYKFSEATIDAAEKMKRELNAKIFKEQISLAFKEGISELSKETQNNKLNSLVYANRLSGLGQYLTVEELEKGNITAAYEKAINSSNNFMGSSDIINKYDDAGRERVYKVFAAAATELGLETSGKLEKQQTQTKEEGLYKVSSLNPDDAMYQEFQKLLVSNNTWVETDATADQIYARIVNKINGWTNVPESQKTSLINQMAGIKNDRNALLNFAKSQNLDISKKSGHWSVNYEKMLSSLAEYLNETYGTEYTKDSLWAAKLFSYKDGKTPEITGYANWEDGSKGESSSSSYELKIDDTFVQDIYKAWNDFSPELQSELLNILPFITDNTETLKELGNSVKENTESNNNLAEVKQFRVAADKLAEYSNVPDGLFSKELQFGIKENRLQRSVYNNRVSALGFEENSDYESVIDSVLLHLLAGASKYNNETNEDYYKRNKTLFDIYANTASQIKVNDLGWMDNLGIKNLPIFKNLNPGEGASYIQSLLSDMYTKNENGEKIIDVDKLLNNFDTMKNIMGDEQFNLFLTNLLKIADASDGIRQTWKDIGKDMYDALSDSVLNGYYTMTSKIGENWYTIAHNVLTAEEAERESISALSSMGSELLSQASQLMVNTGLSLVQYGAIKGAPGIIAGGLMLAGAGGFTNALSGYLNAASNNSSSSSDEIDRLENLKDSLANLLEQARNDAEYYETTLRNKSAIAANDSVSNMTVTKVNDMILTDKGVFSTDPKDTIMAMKDPASLTSSTSVTPNISFTLVNESGQNLNVTTSETKTDANGNIEITAIVNAIVKQGFMNGEYDDSITNMNSRQRGNVVYA